MKIRATRNNRILEIYTSGGITRLGLILETLQFPTYMLDEAFSAFPPEVVEKLKSFVSDYSPEMKIFNGPRPGDGAVQFARKWVNR